MTHSSELEKEHREHCKLGFAATALRSVIKWFLNSLLSAVAVLILPIVIGMLAKEVKLNALLEPWRGARPASVWFLSVLVLYGFLYIGRDRAMSADLNDKQTLLLDTLRTMPPLHVLETSLADPFDHRNILGVINIHRDQPYLFANDNVSQSYMQIVNPIVEQVALLLLMRLETSASADMVANEECNHD